MPESRRLWASFLLDYPTCSVRLPLRSMETIPSSISTQSPNPQINSQPKMRVINLIAARWHFLQKIHFISDIFSINIISCFCYVYKELEMLATESTVHKNVVQFFLLQNSTVAFFCSHCCERKLNFYCHLMKFFIMHETHSFHSFKLQIERKEDFSFCDYHDGNLL
jgi:hypothetical protein